MGWLDEAQLAPADGAQLALSVHSLFAGDAARRQHGVQRHPAAPRREYSYPTQALANHEAIKPSRGI